MTNLEPSKHDTITKLDGRPDAQMIRAPRPISPTLQPWRNPTSALLQLYFSPTTALRQPYFSPTSALLQPYFSST